MEITVNPAVIGIVTGLTATLGIKTKAGGRSRAFMALLLAGVVTGAWALANSNAPAGPEGWAQLGIHAAVNGLGAMGLWSGGKAVAGK